MAANEKGNGAMSDGTPIIDPDARNRISEALAKIEREEGVTILFAVESGSLAWGFPSPDSDYDVRFVYVRPLDWYLGLGKRWDVIEMPIADDLDVSGWDLKKALQLLLAGNPALMEWLRSPITYLERPETAAVRGLAGQTRHRQAATYHYRCLARDQMKSYVLGRETVRLKKYLYCVRPAAALAWLRGNAHGGVPMDLPTILDGIDLPSDLTQEIDRLLAAKSVSSELGEGARIPIIESWVEQEINMARRQVPEAPAENAELVTKAEAVFLKIVRGER
jgi:predicted nucleotidyltransferase